MGPMLRGLGVARTVLRPLLGEERARRACGYVYAVVTLVAYSFEEQYRRAALGILWILLTPLLFLAVYVPISIALAPLAGESLAQRATGPVHVALGFLAWIAFVEGVQNGATSLVTSPDVVRASPISLSVLPAVRVLAALFRSASGMSLLLVLFLAAGGRPGARVLVLPLALLGLGGLILGLALLASAVAAVFRDLLQVLPTLVLLWFFASPVVFLPGDSGVMGETHRLVLLLNPVTPALNLVRASFLPAAPVSTRDLVMAGGWAATSLLLGGLVFRRLSPRFGDHV